MPRTTTRGHQTPGPGLSKDGDPWTEDYKALSKAALALLRHMEHGWPMAADRNHAEWTQIAKVAENVGRIAVLWSARAKDHARSTHWVDPGE